MHLSRDITRLQQRIGTHLTFISQDKCISKLYQLVFDQSIYDEFYNIKGLDH